MVTMFIPGRLVFLTKAYKVVVFPDPVGPVVKIMPFGLFNSFSTVFRNSGCMPKSLRVMDIVLGFKTLKTRVSP